MMKPRVIHSTSTGTPDTLEAKNSFGTLAKYQKSEFGIFGLIRSFISRGRVSLALSYGRQNLNDWIVLLNEESTSGLHNRFGIRISMSNCRRHSAVLDNIYAQVYISVKSPGVFASVAEVSSSSLFCTLPVAIMTELERTLPASWYRSLPIYQLERRAVFLRAWYLLGPVTRFVDANSKVDYEIAQEQIVVQRCSTKSPLPTCDNLEVIHKANGTRLPSYMTPTGLLFAALSHDAPSFHEFYPDLEPLLARIDFTKLPYRRSIKYPGNFNWKTMVDGYQECLHCQYTHPSFSAYYPPTFYSVYNHLNFSQHVADPKKPDDGLFLYFFPNCTLNVYGGGMSSFRVCPTEDPNVTRMEFDYYHLQSGEKFEEYFRFVRQVAMEDFELCERAQENLMTGVYNEGILNPEKETGVSYYQGRVFEMVSQLYDQEQAKGTSTHTDRASKGKEEGTPALAVGIFA